MQSYVCDGVRNEIINFCKETIDPENVALMYETSGVQNRLYLMCEDHQVIEKIKGSFSIRLGSPDLISDVPGKWHQLSGKGNSHWFPWHIPTLLFKHPR
jgi:hypothetical protein